jgi:hypothetical protein
MVPLPLLEWERLRDLSLGKIKFDGPTPRRTMSCATPDLPSPLEVSLGLVPINSPRVILDNASKSLHGHRLTARFMKRCWASVFAQCPVMSWIKTCQKWSVDWGCDVLNREATSRFTDESTFGETWVNLAMLLRIYYCVVFTSITSCHGELIVSASSIILLRMCSW